MKHRTFIGHRSNSLKRTSRRRMQVKKLHMAQQKRRIAYFTAENEI